MNAGARRAAVLVALAISAGCASTRRTDVNDPAIRARMAVTALLNQDFEAARAPLLELASQCEAGEHGRRAVLLLAAAELDTQNESGSPARAAHLARSYLLLPYAPREEIVLARVLYRLAADLGGLDEIVAASAGAPTVAPRFDACGTPTDLRFRPLPATSEATLANKVQELEARLAAQSDSLASMRARSDSLSVLQTRSQASNRRVAELEQELERITQLLTTGAEPQVESARE